jgi:dienelactone hydrolase
MRLLIPLLVAALMACAGMARAQAPELDASLNESVLLVTKKGAIFSFELETTLYKPDGEGPFAIVVINHGKASGDPRFQGRYRPAGVARWFLERGYAVVVPMRQGFSKSGGSYIGGGCNIESNGRVQAEDVKAVLDHVTAQPWADRERIVVMGQSHGGWTTLAFGTLGYPGVRGLVNFAGGLRQDNCTAWKHGLIGAAGGYGREVKLPTLWFYGDNDSYFDPFTFRGMHEKFTAAGGRAELVAFGTFGSDAHGMFGSRAGAAVWQPQLVKFLAAIGMPHERVPAYARHAAFTPMAAPERTEFAALEDASRLPHVRDTGRAGYRVFLEKAMPRAFAIAPNGAWGWADGGDDPLRRALSNCNRRGEGACRLYAVDDHVVWKESP